MFFFLNSKMLPDLMFYFLNWYDTTWAHVNFDQLKRCFLIQGYYFVNSNRFSWPHIWNKQSFQLYCCLSGPELPPLLPWSSNATCCILIINILSLVLQRKEEAEKSDDSLILTVEALESFAFSLVNFMKSFAFSTYRTTISPRWVQLFTSV